MKMKLESMGVPVRNPNPVAGVFSRLRTRRSQEPQGQGANNFFDHDAHTLRLHATAHRNKQQYHQMKEQWNQDDVAARDGRDTPTTEGGSSGPSSSNNSDAGNELQVEQELAAGVLHSGCDCKRTCCEVAEKAKKLANRAVHPCAVMIDGTCPPCPCVVGDRDPHPGDCRR